MKVCRLDFSSGFFDILFFKMLGKSPQFLLMSKTKDIPENEVLSVAELVSNYCFRDLSFSTFAKFSEKLAFLTPSYETYVYCKKC